MNATQLSILADCTPARITQLKQEIIESGHTQIIADRIDYKESAIEYVKNRPKQTNKGRHEARCKALRAAIKEQLGFSPSIISYSHDRPRGWFYRGVDEEDTFLGKNFKLAMDNISYICQT